MGYVLTVTVVRLSFFFFVCCCARSFLVLKPLRKLADLAAYPTTITSKVYKIMSGYTQAGSTVFAVGLLLLSSKSVGQCLL